MTYNLIWEEFTIIQGFLDLFNDGRMVFYSCMSDILYCLGIYLTDSIPSAC